MIRNISHDLGVWRKTRINGQKRTRTLHPTKRLTLREVFRLPQIAKRGGKGRSVDLDLWEKRNLWKGEGENNIRNVLVPVHKVLDSTEKVYWGGS